jgi:hypothetical protein
VIDVPMRDGNNCASKKKTQGEMVSNAEKKVHGRLFFVTHPFWLN